MEISMPCGMEISMNIGSICHVVAHHSVHCGVAQCGILSGMKFLTHFIT